MLSSSVTVYLSMADIKLYNVYTLQQSQRKDQAVNTKTLKKIAANGDLIEWQPGFGKDQETEKQKYIR